MSEHILKTIKDKHIAFVDLRFTDSKGKLQHLTLSSDCINEDFFDEGAMFDASSITGWKAINDSDMKLVPDLETAILDPFYQQETLMMFCDVYDPTSDQAYGRDPRSTGKRALAYLKSTGIADTAYFGPEAEFFVFDDVRWNLSENNTSYKIDSEEGTYNSNREYPGGNLGHRPPYKGGYMPISPVDSGQNFRSEMLTIMKQMGIKIEKHHHEVAPSQHELGIGFNSLVKIADQTQLYKYIIHMVAAAYGKTACFMPKPVLNDNGSGLHVHQSLWKDNQPVFAGDNYADLSETCLYYIGGIIKHGRALNAFANPTTNSYKRLVPGYEAPVLMAYSARNRSASIRIPYSASPKGKRIEARFPDPSSNPYLIFSALLMAGLDGIENKIHPKNPMDKNLYGLPAEEKKNIPALCRTLREACDALDQDREFLKKGGVMSDDQIDSYINLKIEEVDYLDRYPHPAEFSMYYSC